MRWGFPLIATALFLLSPVQLAAQSRSAVMTVSVTVVRSGVTSAAAVTAAADGSTSSILIPSSAERPLPAPPRATETEVALPTPSSVEASSSVMMVTINY